MLGVKENFLWGNSVSSMQTEGAWQEDGKGLSVYDVKKAAKDLSDWHVAIDEYHRYEEDFDWMEKLGMNCYRFQISWSRVFPEGEGKVNEAALAYYERFIETLLNHKIQPMICLYHFDMPLNFAQKYNGFMDRHVVQAFIHFAKTVIDRFSGKVKYWLSFNEQNCFSFEPGFENGGYLKGKHSLQDLYTLMHHSLLAHAEISAYIHENYSDCQIGGMVAYQEFYPASCRPEDILAARKAGTFINDQMLSVFTSGTYHSEVLNYMRQHQLDSIIRSGDQEVLAKTKSDFLALSYYYSTTIDSKKITPGTPPNYYMQEASKENPYLESSTWGWQIDALGFRNVITKLYNQYHLPIFPIENGIGVKEIWDGVHEIEDDYRIDYHREHIRALNAAVVEDGADVMGYLGWGMIDILSSKGDMSKRYGVIYVNRDNHDLKDLARVPKKSFYWLQNVIKKQELE